MFEFSILYRIEVMNIPDATMMKEGSRLLLVLVTVLGSSNRTKHSRDLPIHAALSGNTHTVFDDVDAVVSGTAPGEERQNEQFVKTCGYESPFYLNGGTNMVLQPCGESLSLDYLDGRRMKKTNRFLRLLHCCYNKVSRYKHSTLLTGVFQELNVNNRYRRIAIGYGFHGILQIMMVAKITSNVTCESRPILCFTERRHFENCDLRSESLWSLCRLCHWFVSFQSNLYVTIVNHIALFSFVAYVHFHKTRNDVYVMYRIITKFTLPDTFQVADSCFNIGKKYVKQYIDLEYSYYNPSTFHKHDFLDLFSHLLCHSLQTFSNIFPRTILAFPLTGSLNEYLTRVQNGPISKEDEMCYEVRRLQSFNGVSILQSRIKLARSGFYATGNQDETRCYSCGVTHRKWEMKNLPEQVHRRLYPGCPHLTSGDPRNIPITSPYDESSDRIVGVLQDYPISTVPPNTTRQLSQNSSASDSTQPADASRSTGRLDISRAVYPQFKDRQSRRESFRDWRFSHVQDPETLIAAGFYFAGYRDCVRCFYCGVGLKTWEEQDDPWVVHVRWRSECDYVREIRGEQFIQHALSQNLPSNSTSTNPTSTARESQPMSDQQSSGSQQVQTVQDMSSAVGRAVEMGFERGAIETALSELDMSNTHGIGHSDGVSLERLIESLILTTSSTPHSISRYEESRQTSTTQQSGAGKQSEAESGTPNPSEPASGASVTRAKQNVNSGRESVLQGLDQRRFISPAEERRLAEENESLREESTCKICMDNPCCIVFLPCGHLVTCAECAPALRRCPICRSYIRGSVRVQTTDRL